MQETINIPNRYIVAIVLFIIFGVLFFESYFIVDPGFTVIQLRLGKVIRTEKVSGFYFKFPFIDSTVAINTRINAAEIETKGMSRDLQTVSVGMVINYKIIDPLRIYQQIGVEFNDIIIDPFTQESVKAVIAKFTAEDLIQSRHEAKERVIIELKERLAPLYLDLIDFNFIHLDFTPEFIKAVEDKQIAEQSAKTAKNLTLKVHEEAVQTRARAEAEAFSMQVKKVSVTPELIRIQEIEAQVKAIEKWDGSLPQVTGKIIPFIQLSR
jgi:regulator of protease activity HflC (stomatin/prohibitin superfamily)